MVEASDVRGLANCVLQIKEYIEDPAKMLIPV